MNPKVLLLLLGSTAVLGQSATPKWISPKKASFVELTAYNIAGYTPQQLWQYRNVERVVKFDTSMDCVLEAWKSNGVEQKYDAYCWKKDVHWNVNGRPQCTSGTRSFDVDDVVEDFWDSYDKFTVYQGQVEDPYFQTGVKYHRMKHSTQNRWIWYRTTDKAIVYEQYYDGTQNSWVKFYEGGIVENRYLFTSDFRIAKCTNPYVALPSVSAPVTSFFGARNFNSTQMQNELAEYILKKYDTDKDGELDFGEQARLADDIENWDISKESIKVDDINKWFAQFDKNNDKKITIGEIMSLKSVAQNQTKANCELAEWVMSQYDTDKDGELDIAEQLRLADDLENWDITKESIKVDDIKGWFA